MKKSSDKNKIEKNDTPPSLWEKKHQIILNAARETFLKMGYGETSMDLIAKSAGVSKITIYHHFKDKAELFSEVLSTHVQSLYNQSEITKSSLPTFSIDRSPHEILNEFAVKLISSFSSQTTVSFTRLVIGDLNRFPELVNSIWERGRSPLYEIFIAYLDEEVRSKRLRIPSTSIAGKQFFGMLREFTLWPLLLGTKPLEFTQKKEIADSIVNMFLNFYKT